MKIIDLTCKHCGGTMDFNEPSVEFQTDINSSNNHVLFFNKDDTKMKIECPYCHHKEFAWVAGSETCRINGLTMNVNIAGNGNSVVGIHIGGDVVGSNISIGNNRIIRS